MKQYIEIECKGCGILFTPLHHSQKYCEKCKQNPNPERLARKLDKAFTRNMATYYDIDIEMRESICQFCGKTFQYPAHIGKNKKPPDFCSNKCSSDNRIAETKCAYCGKPMLETEDIHDVMGHNWYCSSECKTAHRWKIARENNEVKTCPVCGKEFLEKNKTYCSRECYLKAPKESPEPEFYQIPCERCRKILKIKGVPNDSAHYLCKSCYKQIEQERKQNTRNDRVIEHKEVISKEKQKELDYIEQNGLCSLCSTSYKDCERMQSNFRISPKGVQYRNSKVVICPKFTSKSIKYIDISMLKGRENSGRKESH